MPSIEENIQRFEELLGSVQRNGMDKLINYIRKKTDFIPLPHPRGFIFPAKAVSCSIA